MSKPLPAFQKMWDNYPTGLPQTIAETIGGAVKTNILANLNTEHAWNTCTIRMSRAFNYAGDRIPKGHHLKKSDDKRIMKTVGGDDKYRYAYRVADIDAYVEEIYGGPKTLGPIESAGKGVLEAFVSGKRLLLIFDFLDATHGTPVSARHADLWDGTNMRYNHVVQNANHSQFNIRYWEFLT